jgi:hypothetical protein
MGYSKGLVGYIPDWEKRSVSSEIRKKAIDFSWQYDVK